MCRPCAITTNWGCLSLRRLQKAEAWGQQVQGLIAQAVKAVREKQSPTGQQAQELLESWLRNLAKLLNRKPGKKLAGWVLGYFESTHHPRMDRYWELVARLKGWEYTPIYGQAFHWLLAGLYKNTGSKMRPG